ncbi:hypothetical protein AAZX31_03G059600 [Glycine max]
MPLRGRIASITLVPFAPPWILFSTIGPLMVGIKTMYNNPPFSNIPNHLHIPTTKLSNATPTTIHAFFLNNSPPSYHVSLPVIVFRSTLSPAPKCLTSNTTTHSTTTPKPSSSPLSIQTDNTPTTPKAMEDIFHTLTTTLSALKTQMSHTQKVHIMTQQPIEKKDQEISMVGHR